MSIVDSFAPPNKLHELKREKRKANEHGINTGIRVTPQTTQMFAAHRIVKFADHQKTLTNERNYSLYKSIIETTKLLQLKNTLHSMRNLSSNL